MQTRPWPIPAPGPGALAFLLQISDSHFGYQPWSYAEGDHMRRDIQQGLVPLPDAVVHTGDIIDGTHWPGSVGPLSAQNAYAMTWLDDVGRGVPVMAVPGNHDLWDLPGRLRSQWETVWGRPGNTVLDLPGMRIVGFCPVLHTSPDEIWQLDDATLSWLDQACGGTTGPVLLADHYPPAELGASASIQPAGGFADLVSSHPNICGMLTGHLHLDISTAQSTDLVTIGNRVNFPVVSDVSSLLSQTLTDRAQSARVPTISWFVTIYPDRWQIYYRAHGAHRWSGPAGQRVTTMDLAAGTITHGM